MRIFRIDYTNADNMFPDGDIVGYYGEHNATQLVITPPQEMTDCADVASYRIAFGLTNCRAVRSETLEKTEAVSFLLFAQITRSETISVQLEGYGTDGNLVMKSETAKKLKFSDSVSGTEITANGKASDLSTEVSANTAARHTHENVATLGALSEADGQLTYKGTAIGERPTNTVEALGELSFSLRTDLASFDAIAIGAFEGDFLFDKIPIGAEIKSIEFRLEGSTEWIDIKSMFEYDGIPHVINMNHAAWGYDYGMYDKMFALITFPNGTTNFLYDAAVGGNNGDIRITYYTDNVGGEDNA